MALAYLFYMFIGLAIISGILVVMLFLAKNEKVKNITFNLLILWSLFICFINVSSLPSNFIIERLVGYIIGLLVFIGLYIKIKIPNKINLAYIFVVSSTLLGLIDLFSK